MKSTSSNSEDHTIMRFVASLVAMHAHISAGRNLSQTSIAEAAVLQADELLAELARNPEKSR